MEEQQILEKPPKKIDFKLLGIVLLVAIAFSFYYFQDKLRVVKPYQVLTPSIYEEGTVVALYKEIPPGFPKEVVLESKKLHYSGTVTAPQGRTKITLSYFSDKSMLDVANLYAESLPRVGWNISRKSVYDKAVVIEAAKKDKSILLTIAPVDNKGVMVTFRYEK